MERTQLTRLIRNAWSTQVEEIDCATCLQLVSTYVDVQLAGGIAAPEMAPLGQHLEQCQICFEEYTLLKELAEMEARGQTPSIETLREAIH